MTRLVGSGLLIMAVALAGCTANPAEQTAPTPAATTASPTSESPSPSVSPSPTASPTTKPTTTPKPKPKPDPISVQALIEKKYNGRGLKLGRQIGETSAYKRYLISYRGDKERISGVMLVPDGKGPFPVLVLNHGYINPDTYFPGQRLYPRERD